MIFYLYFFTVCLPALQHMLYKDMDLCVLYTDVNKYRVHHRCSINIYWEKTVILNEKGRGSPLQCTTPASWRTPLPISSFSPPWLVREPKKITGEAKKTSFQAMTFAFPFEQASSSGEARTESPTWEFQAAAPWPLEPRQHPPCKYVIRAAELKGSNPLILQIRILRPSEMEQPAQMHSVSFWAPLASLLIHGDLLVGDQWPSCWQNARGRGCHGI